MEQIELEEVKKIAIEASILAGDLIRKANHQKKKIDEKEDNPTNLVTDIDVKCELLIIDYLKKNLKNLNIDWKFYCEETTKNVLSNDPTFIIDPIDGTINFCHDFPLIAVSIGLVINKKPILGVIHSPSTNDTFWAIKGKGAWKYDPISKKNVKKLQCSSVKSISSSILSTNYPYDRSTNELLEVNDVNLKFLQKNVHGIRFTGSAVINLLYCCEGSLDGYYERYLKPWDLVAGCCILKESGGFYCDIDIKNETMKEFDLSDYKYFICGSSKELLKEMVKDIIPVYSKYQKLKNKK